MTSRSQKRPSNHWHLDDVHKPLSAVGTPQRHRIDEFVYDINHLLRCCESMPKAILALRRAIRKAPRDSTALHGAALNLVGQFEHLKYHMPRATRVLRRLRERARHMQPMCEMSDEELRKKWAVEAQAKAKSAWEAAQKKRAKGKVSKAKRVSKRGRS